MIPCSLTDSTSSPIGSSSNSLRGLNSSPRGSIFASGTVSTLALTFRHLLP
jgi:hypothetical protein